MLKWFSAVLLVLCGSVRLSVSATIALKNETDFQARATIRYSSQFLGPVSDNLYRLDVHSVAQVLGDLLMYWKRKSIVLVTDHLMDLSPEFLRDYLMKVYLISISNIVVVSKLKSDLPRPLGHVKHIVVVCGETNTRKIIMTVQSMNLFNAPVSWLFVLKDVLPENWTDLAPLSAQINLLVPSGGTHENNNCVGKEYRKRFSVKMKEAILKKVTVNLSPKTFGCLESWQIYSVFRLSVTAEVELLKLGDWRRSSGRGRGRLGFYENIGEVDSIRKLRGAEVTVSTFWVADSMVNIINETTPPTITGVFKQILDTAGSLLNISLKYRVRNHTIYGNEEDGCFYGVIGELQNRETDVAMLDLSMYEARTRVIKFLPPIYTLYSKVVILNPRLQGVQELYGPAFSVTLWIIAGVAWFLIVGAILVSQVLAATCKKTVTGPKHVSFAAYDPSSGPVAIFRNRYADRLVWMVSGKFFEDAFSNPSGTATRIHCIIFFAFVWLLLTFYNSALISQLTYAKPPLPFSDLRGLLNTPEYYISLVDERNYDGFLEAAQDELYQKLWLHVQNRSTDNVFLLPETIAKFGFFEKPFAAVGSQLLIQNHVGPNCKFVTIGDHIFTDPLHFGVRTDFPYFALLKSAVIRLLETGFVKRLVDNNLHIKRESPMCHENLPADEIGLQLRLDHLRLAFMVLGAGFVLAISVCLCELMVKKLQKNRSVNKSVAR